jgi:hypothetical protein
VEEGRVKVQNEEGIREHYEGTFCPSTSGFMK